MLGFGQESRCPKSPAERTTSSLRCRGSSFVNINCESKFFTSKKRVVTNCQFNTNDLSCTTAYIPNIYTNRQAQYNNHKLPLTTVQADQQSPLHPTPSHHTKAGIQTPEALRDYWAAGTNAFSAQLTQGLPFSWRSTKVPETRMLSGKIFQQTFVNVLIIDTKSSFFVKCC